MHVDYKHVCLRVWINLFFILLHLHLHSRIVASNTLKVTDCIFFSVGFNFGRSIFSYFSLLLVWRIILLDFITFDRIVFVISVVHIVAHKLTFNSISVCIIYYYFFLIFLFLCLANVFLVNIINFVPLMRISHETNCFHSLTIHNQNSYENFEWLSLCFIEKFSHFVHPLPIQYYGSFFRVKF